MKNFTGQLVKPVNSKKLKIGFVYDDSIDRQDGVSMYVKSLGSWLSSQGHQVTYIVGQTKLPEWSGGTVHSMSRNIWVKFNGNRVFIPLPANLRAIKKVIEQEKLDIIHVQTPYSPFMAQKVINNIGSKTAIIGTFHILPVGKLQYFGSKLLSLIYGKSVAKFDKMIAGSPGAQLFAKRAFNLESSVLPHPVDVSKFSKGKNLNKSNKKRIVYLGRLVERKGVFRLVQAVNELVKRGITNVELVIAGDGPQRNKIENFIRSRELSRYITLLGYIDEKDKPDILASADIACFPAMSGESFGIVIIEAMAARSKVVLAGNNPGYSSVLADQNIQLINSYNITNFADRLELLLNDQDLISKIDSWQQTNIGNFDISFVGKKLVKEYRNAIDNHNK